MRPVKKPSGNPWKFNLPSQFHVKFDDIQLNIASDQLAHTYSGDAYFSLSLVQV